MHTESIERWVHNHTFGQDEKKSAERRTLVVSVVTILTMIVEIGAGIVYGSMALLADGLHMGSHASARVLLDLQAPGEVLGAIRASIESEGDDRVSDLHVWSVGPGIYAAEIAIVSSRPRGPDDYYKLLPEELGLVHVTVETHRCAADVREGLRDLRHNARSNLEADT